MKRTIIILSLLLLNFSSIAQTPESFVKFPDTELIGLSFKPELGFVTDSNGKFLLMLGYKSHTGYSYFNCNSQIWFKFSDGTILKTLGILGTHNGEIILLDSGYFRYTSIAIYLIDKSEISELLNRDKIFVEKIRIYFTDYNYEDYIIKNTYQQRFKKKLLKSIKLSNWYMSDEF